MRDGAGVRALVLVYRHVVVVRDRVRARARALVVVVFVNSLDRDPTSWFSSGFGMHVM